MIETDKLKRILPRCKDPDTWSFELSMVLPSYDIMGKERIASFLAQTGHESAHFNVLVENLNYSADGLRKTFSKYFPDDRTAARYARQPVWIASRVYANRMANGNEQSQDGWKYRGRGILQLTGKSNYMRCSRALFGDDRLVDDPDLLLKPEYALMSACWFWRENKLNQWAHDVHRTTRIVNGGTHGLADRISIYERAMNVL
jgi:putative chitinase